MLYIHGAKCAIPRDVPCGKEHTVCACPCQLPITRLYSHFHVIDTPPGRRLPDEVDLQDMASVCVLSTTLRRVEERMPLLSSLLSVSWRSVAAAGS
jgi:hypothetical protein